MLNVFKLFCFVSLASGLKNNHYWISKTVKKEPQISINARKIHYMFRSLLHVFLEVSLHSFSERQKVFPLFMYLMTLLC